MIRKIARCIREYKRDTILTPICMIGEVSLECVIPLVTAKLINAIQDGCEMTELVRYGLFLVLLAMGSMACGVLSGWFCASASSGFARNLRHDLYAKVKNFSFANIDAISTSSLVTRLTTDVTNVQNAFMMIIRIAVRAPLMLVFAVVMAVYVGKKLSLVFVLVIPILAAGLFTIIHKAMPLFRSVFRKYDAMNESIQENVKGMRVVKSFVREDYEKKKFAVTSEDVCADFTKAEKILAFNNPLMIACMYICMLIIPYFAAKWIISTAGLEMQVGNLSSLLTYSMQILMSLMMVSMIFVMVTMAAESARRIVEVLDTESTIRNPVSPVMTVRDGSVSFENVQFKYAATADKYALSDINLQIRSGQTVGIIGGTGSSKSTLIQLISRLYDVTEGCVRVGGVDVRDYDLETLRNAVAVVLQKNVLFSGTIKENLRWGDPEASDEELKRICRLAQADEFIEAFPDKYDTYIEQGGANVSGGQKQRLCIARALLKKPKILILDDSTSAVDTKTDAMIRKAFREEIPGTTKIIIAQRISSVEDADLIVVMDNGHIDGCGDHETLLRTNAIYREVYQSQNNANAQEKGGESDAQ